MSCATGNFSCFAMTGKPTALRRKPLLAPRLNLRGLDRVIGNDDNSTERNAGRDDLRFAGRPGRKRQGCRFPGTTAAVLYRRGRPAPVLTTREGKSRRRVYLRHLCDFGAGIFG